jgi:TetR/AcrR family transcriptional regulator, transcriptional repressor for nem operon
MQSRTAFASAGIKYWNLAGEGQADHSIPGALDPEATARVMVYLTQGMRVVGKAGRQPPDTPAVVEIAMKLVT